MILLLGASGYVGQSFARELRRRSWAFVELSARKIAHDHPDVLMAAVRDLKANFLINAAGYAGNPKSAAEESDEATFLTANTLLPHTIAEVCAAVKLPWGHVSCGCIYSGTKVDEGDASQGPDRIRGFSEADEPNRSFRHAACTFYSGTKALAEEAIAGVGENYIWRLNDVFDEADHPRNYLSRLAGRNAVSEVPTSLSHRADAVRACLDLWKSRAPFGTYNVVNSGFLSVRELSEKFRVAFKCGHRAGARETPVTPAESVPQAPAGACALDNSKLFAAGVTLRPVHTALDEALRNWDREQT